MRGRAERERIETFLRTLGRELRHPIRFYLVGGTVLVHRGLRESTLDVDFTARADCLEALDELERLIPRLKDRLDINVKPASPADFVPVRGAALNESLYVRSYGPLAVYHYDLVSTALAKIARGTERDLTDIELLLDADLLT